MEINDEWIAKHKPCKEAVDWWDKKECDSLKILNKLMNEKKYTWANWFIVRTMTYRQYVSYAVFAAEQVIDIYEKKYFDDRRPREAIEAAKKCIENPSKKNQNTAHIAANDAAAIIDDADDVDYVTVAAYAAAIAAVYVAATAAATAADAADAAAIAANATDAANAGMLLKILQYGMKLVKGE